ncbi:beta-ketoacyl-ACP synthase (plasmid) [Nitrobacter sp. NHB1]|uniref:beta-ketoacyl-ACP synthase n=1 Tax=Nitrobacter sp. NHB1 TaxID=3119830 RepID=UPI002FFFF8F9
MSQFPKDRRETWITGIGIISSLGDGLEATWEALQEGRVNVDRKTYAPWLVHPLPPLELNAQIPKKGDQRQMEAWQRIGTYAAGLALDSAGIKGDREILARTDMIVAAGGGERDLDVDAAILTSRADDKSGALNERLMNDLRPTLFLAQLSNLLAGNISIVHGVSGSSRTFMGEEAAGVDAVRIAWARIAYGQSEVALVGAAHNGERKEMLMLYECGGFNLKTDFASVWSRNGAGFALGSGGVFLVLESKTHAERRCAKPFARLVNVVSGHSSRSVPGGVENVLKDLWASLAVTENATAIYTAATGAADATAEEAAFLSTQGDIPVRAVGSSFGHLCEAQFPLALALASLSLSRSSLVPPNDTSGRETETHEIPAQIVTLGVGHWRGEGMALVEAVS